MKKIATITFHGAHNYGSNLQAYALQEYIKRMFESNNEPIEYSILNLRTKTQLGLYSIFKPNNNVKNIIKNIILLPYLKQLRIKFKKFEEFINNNLEITSINYSTEAELENSNLKYDYYISGSDQLWNVRATDFNWANLLGFSKNAKKISYSASFGPLDINWDLYDKERFSKLLDQYDSISVREVGSYNQVKTLTNKESEIHVDPTLLLSVDEWEKLIGDDRQVKQRYIFFYSLETSREDIKLVKAISKKLGLPVVITKYANKNDYFNSFIKRYDSGPIDYLNLIKNADLVISASFHGMVFPIIFNVPFYAINGLADNRIGNLLNSTKLQDRSISNTDWEIKVKEAFNIDFNYSNQVIEKERNRSRRYLEEALEII